MAHTPDERHVASSEDNPVSLLKVGFCLRCPRCGKGKVFSGLLTIRDACSDCGLSLKDRDVGDGPAFFAIVLVGFIVVPIAAIVEYKLEPSPLITIPLWGGMVVGLSLLVLRTAKATLIALHYRLRKER